MINFYKTLIDSSSKEKIRDNSEIEILQNNNVSKCPYCKSKEIIKYGMYKSNQRFKCKNDECGKTFTNEFYNQFRYSKKFKENCQEYLELLNAGHTIRECASKLNITIVTAFFWRHRFLYDIKNKSYIEKITSYVELTKMVVRENFKGSREIYDEKRDSITVINAINDSIDIIPIIAARNFFGFYEIRDNLIPRLDKRSYVVGLIDGRLKIFSKAFNEINKVKIRKCNEINIDIRYSINTQKWLSKFRGIATKYLDHYLSWRLFDYKNNILQNEVNYDLLSEISTYISWNEIKSKQLLV